MCDAGRRTGQGIQRGDVYWVVSNVEMENIKRPRTADASIKGTRPAIIVSCDKRNKANELVNIVYATSAPRGQEKEHIPVALERPSVALCEQPQTIPASRLGGYITHLSDMEMASIDNALREALALDNAGEYEGDSTWKARYEAMHVAYSEMLMHVMRIVKNRVSTSSSLTSLIDEARN